MNNRRSERKSFIDGTGAVFSWICAVHCVAVPLIVSFLPFAWLSVLDNEIVEYVLVGTSLLIAAASLLPSYIRDHRKIRSIAIFAFGIGLIFLADRLFEENLAGKAVMLALGALTISLAHVLNRKLCRECTACSIHRPHSS